MRAPAPLAPVFPDHLDALLVIRLQINPALEDFERIFLIGDAGFFCPRLPAQNGVVGNALPRRAMRRAPAEIGTKSPSAPGRDVVVLFKRRPAIMAEAARIGRWLMETTRSGSTEMDPMHPFDQ